MEWYLLKIEGYILGVQMGMDNWAPETSLISQRPN